MDTDHDKIIRSEEKLDALSKVVYEIKDNHIAHLSTDLSELKKSVSKISNRLALWSGGIMVGVWIIEHFLTK